LVVRDVGELQSGSTSENPGRGSRRDATVGTPFQHEAEVNVAVTFATENGTTRALAIAALLYAGASLLSCHGSSVTFDPHRASLYTQAELWNGFDASRHSPGFDALVYKEYIDQGKFYPTPAVAQLRSAHDNGVMTALKSYVHDSQRQLIAMVGSGSATLRCSETYDHTVRLAWKLVHEGRYQIVTGGGPGQMEAANLGAYLADQPIEAIDHALEIMRSRAIPDFVKHEQPPKGSEKCDFEPREYTAAAQAVIDRYPQGHENLGIPTWFYGSEPTNRFATRIAKFFSNGIREDLLISISVGGIVIAPGSAGTRQEVFMDATKIYYATFCYLSPTVFFGTKTYGPLRGSAGEPDNPGIYDLVRRLTKPDAQDLLLLTDDADETVRFFKASTPRRFESDVDACRNMP
jgi:predicted Rossmann-fold nucleotide-binding protein